MKKTTLALFVGVVVLLALSAKQNPDYWPSIENISAEAIRAHMRFLSSDLLFGRDPGTQGYEIAAKYMVSQFEKMGLEPAGDDSSYFQQVTLSRYDLDYSGSAIAVINQDETKLLSLNDSYFIYTRHNVEVSSEESEMVFGGFGLDYPDNGYQPLKDENLEGKLLVAVLGTPAFAPALQSAGIYERIGRAEALGAKGLLLIPSMQLLTRYTWSRLLNMSGRGLEIKAKNTPDDFFTVLIHPREAVELTGFSIDSLMAMANDASFQAFELSPRLNYHISTDRNEDLTTSPNVVAGIEGSDPVLKDEYIVYTAHLDHVGLGWPVYGDSIYNGAYDNASGCAILLEIANAFRNVPKKPSRSVLFIALTAEEIGLFGSRYFVQYPTVPLRNIVANINIDMLLMEGPLERVVALGKELADFEDIVEKSAADVGVQLVPDPLPHERLFMRSDHYSFVQKGIPAVFIINDLTDSLNNAWFKSKYHSPYDEFSESMHFDAGVKHAQLNFLIGYRIAERPERPKWRSNSPYARE